MVGLFSLVVVFFCFSSFSNYQYYLPTNLPSFGPGPHQVEFSVILPEPKPDQPDRAVLRKFVVELAPLDAVPHAVHFFLEQVAHQLWDGTYFYLNGPHVVQVGPQYFDADMEHDHPDEIIPHFKEDEDRNRAMALQYFREFDLEKLAFPDYSDTYPHKAWTLGFAGRPSGPDFYVNKVDNTDAHGPGGQNQHALGEEQGDPCFGTITSGRDVVARIFSQKTHDDKSEWHYFFEDPVEIKSARIISALPKGQDPDHWVHAEVKAAAAAAATQTTATSPLQQQQQSQSSSSSSFTTTITGDSTKIDVPSFVADAAIRDEAAAAATAAAALAAATAAAASEAAKGTTTTDEKDPVELIHEKLYRKPRLPKLAHQVDP
jgi:cyclophilin family peptidyl-prolyl cis-trans isomerase